MFATRRKTISAHSSLIWVNYLYLRVVTFLQLYIMKHRITDKKPSKLSAESASGSAESRIAALLFIYLIYSHSINKTLTLHDFQICQFRNVSQVERFACKISGTVSHWILLFFVLFLLYVYTTI